jgi:hypothetical protein
MIICKATVEGLRNEKYSHVTKKFNGRILNNGRESQSTIKKILDGHNY